MEQVFSDGRRSVLFANGTCKQQFPDGHTAIRFTNNDIKRFFPCGKLPAHSQAGGERACPAAAIYWLSFKLTHFLPTFMLWDGLCCSLHLLQNPVHPQISPPSSMAHSHPYNLQDPRVPTSCNRFPFWLNLQDVWSTTIRRWTPGIPHMPMALRCFTSQTGRQKHITLQEQRKSSSLMASSGKSLMMGENRMSLLSSCPPQ